MEGRGQSVGPSWFATLLGVVVLVATGFAFGLIAGVVSQEPALVMGHVQGRGEAVRWTRPEGAATAVAALSDDSMAADPGAAEKASRAGRDLPAVGSDGPKPTPASSRSPRSKTLAGPVTASQSEVPSAPPAPASVSSSAGRYSVQVRAFEDSQGADRVAAMLGEKGYPVYVTPTATTGDGRWRVRVGPVSGRSRAEQVAKRLKHEEQLPTWVLAEGGH